MEVEKAKKIIKEAADDTINISEQKLEELQDAVDQLKAQATKITNDAAESSISYIKEKPLHSVAFAALAGFALGAILVNKSGR